MAFDLIFNCTDGSGAGSYDNLLTLTLSATLPNLNAAPAPIWFECTSVSGSQASGPVAGNVYDPQSHRIVYFWDFGDAANATPSNAPILNMPGEWKNLNQAYGRKVVHVYKTGRVEPYTVTCYAYEPETKRFGIQSIEVTIGEADTVFADDATIIFNPGGSANVSGYPNATVITTTWADVLIARAALGAGSLGRILVADGVTLTERLLYSMFNPVAVQNQEVNYANFWVQAMPGASVTVQAEREPDGLFSTASIATVDNNIATITLVDLHFVGGWDSTTETGTANDLISGSSTRSDFVQLVSGCTFTGMDAVNRPVVAAGGNLVIHETTITNWRDYGVRGGTTNWRSALLGCAIFQHPDALSGGIKNNLYNRHGSVREFGSDVAIVSVCDLFSRNGWVSGTGGTDLQPTLRINTNGNPGVEFIGDRICSEGTIALTEQNSTNIDVPMNVVFDKLLTIRGAKGMFEVIWQTYGGVTLRNWLAVQLDVPVAARNFGSLVDLDTRDTDAEGLAAPVELYNITMLDLRDDANANNVPLNLIGSTQDASGPFQNLTVENNILHQPRRTGVTNEAAPIDITTVIPGVVSRDRGPRFNFHHIGGNAALGSDVVDGASMAAIPYSQITTDLYNQTDGAVTDQAYWNVNLEAKSRLTLHAQNLSVRREYRADRGDFTVTVGPAGITITNTSGDTWRSADYWSLRLDRTAQIPPFNPAFNTQGAAIPLPTPQAGSAALTGGSADLSAYDDLLGGSERPLDQSGAVIG